RVRRCESLSLYGSVLCTASASLLYLKGARTQPLGPRQVGPTMQYKITYCSYIMASQAKEISLLDSLAFSRSPSSIMSWRCLVETEPDVASGIARHVAERLCRE